MPAQIEDRAHAVEQRVLQPKQHGIVPRVHLPEHGVIGACGRWVVVADGPASWRRPSSRGERGTAKDVRASRSRKEALVAPLTKGSQHRHFAETGNGSENAHECLRVQQPTRRRLRPPLRARSTTLSLAARVINHSSRERVKSPRLATLA